MTRTVLLNKEDHKPVRIDTRHSLELAETFGDNVNACLTFVGEMRSMQAHYPLFFQKDGKTELLYPVALLGFEQGENLFLGEEQWDAPYIPALIARQPFSIGLQKDPDTQQERRVVHIDMDSPRVRLAGTEESVEGEKLFLEFGGTSNYLQKMSELLESIHLGMEQNKLFSDALLKHKLVESFNAEIELEDGSLNQLIGYYTINEEVLFALSADALHELNEQGFLAAVYMMLASQSQLSNLIARKNAILE
ncbi:SapC family protein [Paraneptunicella aestuarii]|uniref:SapC family protein n=1 Tax=Paraneptunicella aestuarii TaxID=2831148 RepID=UPI001E472F38|nr:SapC family protein [Paraneptunicella aestuarii]UAA37702.1 SapC family protein [Paraneptunicella aestuarii]